MPNYFSQIADEVQTDQAGNALLDRPVITFISPTVYVVAWQQGVGSTANFDIYARVFDIFGHAMTDSFRVNTITTGPQDYVNIGAAPNGDFIISWQGPDTDGHGSAIFSRYYLNNTFQPLDATERVVSDHDASVVDAIDLGFSDGLGGPAMATAGSGETLIIWTQQVEVKSPDNSSESHSEVFGARLSTLGVPGIPFMITPGEAYEAPDVQSFSMGVIWHGSGYAVLYDNHENFRDVPGSENGTFDINSYVKFLNSAVPTIKLAFRARDIAYIGDGAFVVVGTNDANGGDIVAQVFGVNGLALTAVTTINTHTAGMQSRPTVAGFGDGDASFVVSWVDPSDGGINFAVLHKDMTFVANSDQKNFQVVNPSSYYETGLPGVAVGPSGNFVVAWAGGDDTVWADGRHIYLDTFTISAVHYSNQFTGTPGNDTLTGTDLNDDMSGLGGVDVLRPGKGDDRADGGSGNDRVSYFQTDATLGGVQVSLLKQGITQDLGWAGKDILIAIEHLSGTPFADRLEGDNGANWLWGSPSYNGGTFYPSNNDTLIGNGGNDLLVVGTGNHTISGGTGNDTLVFSELGAEPNGVHVSLLQQGVAQATGAGTWTLSGIENLSGGIQADTLTGDANANILAGDEGNDLLVGMGGDDTLFGDGYFWVNGNLEVTLYSGSSGGNDILVGGLGEDKLFGGPGIDTASYAGDEGGVFVNLTLGRGYGNASFGDTYDSIENVIGTDYNDFIIGDPGVNRLDGAGGNDIIIGAVGADEIVGGAGEDWASYEDNSGVVFVNLTLKQGYNNAAHGDTYDGIENLIGGLMDDFFIGDDSANRLNGAMGADTLLGAGGADFFMFTYAPSATSTWGNPNVDLILDFTTGVDKIELSSGAFPGLAVGVLSVTAFHAGTAAHDADDRIIYDNTTGKLWFDPDGTGGQAAMLFATLGESIHPAAIAATDFVVV